MSSPPSKKQKTDNVKSPIIFSCPGQSPDVKLMVFDQAFHVHSVLLKMNSAFFRKFLDSPDKLAARAATTVPSSSTLIPLEESRMGFQYDWGTHIDIEGDGWSLISNENKERALDYKNYKGDVDNQINAFQKLLCALYTQSYQLDDAEELLLMTELADYYCALPILSRTLDGTMIKSPRFCSSIQQHHFKLFIAAAKLRNALLFRECLIWVVGPHQNPSYTSLEDKKLQSIAATVHRNFSERVFSAAGKVFRQAAWVEKSSSHYLTPQLLQILEEFMEIDDDMPHYARWFRTLDKNRGLFQMEERVAEEIEEILENKFVLYNTECRAGDARCGHGDYFFCASINDEDLPWDVNEVDW